MNHTEVKFGLSALVAIFFILILFFRKKIGYFFCPLPEYEGKVFKGKSHYLFLIHFFLSFVISLIIYGIINDYKKLNELFDDVIIRILSIFGIWVVSFYFIGILIEGYLLKTDLKYKKWRNQEK